MSTTVSYHQSRSTTPIHTYSHLVKPGTTPSLGDYFKILYSSLILIQMARTRKVSFYNKLATWPLRGDFIDQTFIHIRNAVPNICFHLRIVTAPTLDVIIPGLSWKCGLHSPPIGRDREPWPAATEGRVISAGNRWIGAHYHTVLCVLGSSVWAGYRLNAMDRHSHPARGKQTISATVPVWSQKKITILQKNIGVPTVICAWEGG